jgi:hypothetical protein
MKDQKLNIRYAFMIASLLIMVLSIAPPLPVQAINSAALGTSWKGFADTDLNFTEFFSGDHTLSLWFMPQFPNAYEGPFVAENGSGVFVLGQGDFLAAPAWGTKLFLAVGSQAKNYPAALQAGQWYHLAVVARIQGSRRLITLYLDGAQLGTPLAVRTNDPLLPTGTLRFGKRTTGQTVNLHNAQYYGFLDDIAVFNRPLSQAVIQGLASSKSLLTGRESGLLAGYTFSKGRLPTKLSRPVNLSAGAQTIIVSTNRDNAVDALNLPLPTQHEEMRLPFPPGEAWFVVQGYDTANGSHKGYASFTWDFILADQPSSGEYPNGSGGAPLYASSAGIVVTVRESEPLGTNVANLLEIEQSPEEIQTYLHLRQNSIKVELGDAVIIGQQVALTGSTGMGACFGCNHLHFGVLDKPDGTPGFITLPIAFSNYEVRDSSGRWQPVARGIPLFGEVIRNSP